MMIFTRPGEVEFRRVFARLNRWAFLPAFYRPDETGHERTLAKMARV